MNTPSPLVPQGALERQSKSKSTVRIAIFTIVSIHAVFFAGLLMQGCRQDETKTPVKTADAATNQNSLPSLESNTYYAPTQDVGRVLAPAPLQTAPPAATDPQYSSSLPSPSISDFAPEGPSYTIVKGDTLAKIAKAHGTTVAAITQINPDLDPTRLRPGKLMQLPTAATLPAPARGIVSSPQKPEAILTTGNRHTVKAGETLSRIAKQHGTTVKAIRAANQLKSDRVVVGQKLKLPAAHASNSSGVKVGSTQVARVNPVAKNSR